MNFFYYELFLSWTFFIMNFFIMNFFILIFQDLHPLQETNEIVRVN